MKLSKKLSYSARWFPAYLNQRLTRGAPKGRVHLVIALADHFEPAYVPRSPWSRAPLEEQERRMETWCREFPKVAEPARDSDGCVFARSYFYPAEQYHPHLLAHLAHHCQSGFGEIEIHLHHGVGKPDTAENTRRQLVEFRDALARDHGALCYWEGKGDPMYSFIHGSFALANSNAGRACGVDSEMQVLSETGCYADMTLPTGPFHRSQTAKINSLYECTAPLDHPDSFKSGCDLEVGRAPRRFPLMIQGPLLWNFHPVKRKHILGIENGALTAPNPPSLKRLQLWKNAAIAVHGRPDWLFVKLHCHGMDPTQREAMLGAPMQQFLRDLTHGAAERNEILHFVTAREMANIILAACDGRDGNPGDYRDYRLKRARIQQPTLAAPLSVQEVSKG